MLFSFMQAIRFAKDSARYVSAAHGHAEQNDKRKELNSSIRTLGLFKFASNALAS